MAAELGGSVMAQDEGFHDTEAGHTHRSRGRLLSLVAFVALSCILVPIAIYLYLSKLDDAQAALAIRYVNGITRGAIEGYKRETACSENLCPCEEGCCVNCGCVPCDSIGARLNPDTFTLCGSAQPVPSSVPREPYKPDSREGHDFHSGGPLRGWTCLHFEIDQALTMQLGYDATGMAQSTRAECRGETGLFQPKTQPWPCPCGHDGFEAYAVFRSALNDEEMKRVSRSGRLNESCKLVVDPAAQAAEP